MNSGLISKLCHLPWPSPGLLAAKWSIISLAKGGLSLRRQERGSRAAWDGGKWRGVRTTEPRVQSLAPCLAGCSLSLPIHWGDRKDCGWQRLCAPCRVWDVQLSTPPWNSGTGDSAGDSPPGKSRKKWGKTRSG